MLPPSISEFRDFARKGQLMRRLLIVVATAGLLLGVAGAASAAGPTWLTGETIEPTANASINGLSCPTYTTCLAAASNTPVVQDDGLSYEPDPDPDQLGVLNAVSCAPGTDFCMFVDDSGGAVSYSNGDFGARAGIDGDIGIESVSCPSAGFCMAIDDNNKVFKYSNGAWDGGTQLSTGAHAFNMSFVNVSCASSSFCIALAYTSDGELYYTWDGNGWSGAGGPFDASDTISLSCTSTTFCLETDEAGFASVFSGSAWSTPQHVDNPQGIALPKLYSACVGTSCVGVDNSDNFIQTGDGTTWTAAVNIGEGTGLTAKRIYSIACATPALCVVGDGEGDTSTYAIPPNPTAPTLTGSATVGQTLTLTNGSVQNPPVWYYDDWFRCDNPGVTCSIDPISTSTSSYTLAAADAGEYIEARESFGFGFDIEGFIAGDPLVSNIVGPISTGGGGGGGGTSHTLAVTKNGTGSGTVTSAPAGINCGAACSAGFNNGTEVTLTATAAGGSTFVGWSGGGCSGTGTCVVALSSDQTITATFATVSPPVARCTLKAVSNKVHLKKKPATLSLRASCDQAASGTVTGTLKAVIKKKTKTFHLGATSVRLTAGGTAVVNVKLPSAAVRALKSRAKESAAFTLRATNANGTASATATIPRLRGV
jgi:hypothetical protein